MIGLITAKNTAIFFALAAMAFCVATIVLAIEKANLESELQDALEKLVNNTILTTPSTSTTNSNTSTEFPWPTTSVAENGPSFPTLPPGLPNPEQIIYRLPLDIQPIIYNVYIHPRLETKTCEGTVSIQIEIDRETNLIVMHAKNLEIYSLSILSTTARIRIRVKKYYLDIEREMLFIELEEILYKSMPYMVSISYSCQLDGLHGIYVSSYLNQTDENSSGDKISVRSSKTYFSFSIAFYKLQRGLQTTFIVINTSPTKVENLKSKHFLEHL